MKKTIFKGMASALITPMNENGVDYEALGRFIDFQIENGINALVAVGTTGENATLEPEEQKEVIRFTVERAAGRVPVIAGTGTNNTEHVLHNTRNACEVGADAVLVVTPYYNKANPQGLTKSFLATAEATSKPIILYNVPSRTGVDIPIGVYQKLSRIPNIAGVKEASSDIVKIARSRSACGPDFSIWSGNDDQIVPTMSLGGKGVISVLSNILPAETSQMCKDYLNGDVAKAFKLTVDETGYIGIREYLDEDTARVMDLIMTGVSFFPERIDGIVKGTITGA